MRSRGAWIAVLVGGLVGCGGAAPPPVAVGAHPAGQARGEHDDPSHPPKDLGTRVSLPSSPGASGYLVEARAGGSGKHAAIVVIQEWWGVTDWVKRNTERFADQGYVALAGDLYRGRATNDAGEAHELMRGLPQDRALADLEAAFQYLASRPDVDPSRIGAIGWCMGGGYAADFAVSEPRLRAVVINYGHVVTDPKRVAKTRAALLGNFAGQDRGISPDDVATFERLARAAKLDVDFKIYPTSQHAFMRSPDNASYDPVATQDAWQRIDAFFARTLEAKR